MSAVDSVSRRQRAWLLTGAAALGAVALVGGLLIATSDGGGGEEVLGGPAAGPDAAPDTSAASTTDGESVSPSSSPTAPSATPTITASPTEGLTAPSSSSVPNAVPTTPSPAPATTRPPAPPASAPPTDGAPVFGATPRTGSVTLTMTPDRSAVRVGERMTTTTVLANGTGTAIAVQSACPPFALLGLGAAPASDLKGRLKTYRDRALADSMRPIPLTEDFGPCRGFSLNPGTARTLRTTWTAATVNGSAFDGTVRLYASASYKIGPGSSARKGTASIAYDPDLLTVRSPDAPLRLSGGDPTRMSPARALDLALADPAFALLVSTTDPDLCPPEDDNAHRRVLFDDRYLREERPGYGVSVCLKHSIGYEDSRTVTVDPDTGEVGPVVSTGYIA